MNFSAPNNRELTTFRVLVNPKQIFTARWPKEFSDLYAQASQDQVPYLVLGQGSNVLFVEDFAGYIVLNKYLGIKVQSKSDHYLVQVHSGVTIDELIDYCQRFKIWGLENLSLIPSSVGTAVVGNIGAYGAEFSQFVDQVTVLNLRTDESFSLSNQECKFSYRDSIFKHEYRDGYIVTDVTLKISKDYQPNLRYSPLDKLDPQQATAKQIREIVNQTRREKLPDYHVTGNAGSFFMNPVVDAEKFAQLQKQWPNIVHYPAPEGKIKLSAGWLIDQAGLKGFQLDNAQISPKHALVLTNTNQQASGREIAFLAKHTRDKVFAKFGVLLVPEVRFIASHGEVDATLYLDQLV